MKFRAEVHGRQIFHGMTTYDPMPVLSVRLLTAAGRFVKENGAEKHWPALWDTGSFVTVIPNAFVETMRLQFENWTTSEIGGFDSEPKKYKYYSVQIGLPGLPKLGVLAIAPEGEHGRSRQHITLGRDVLARLHTYAMSNVIWGGQIPESAVWEWHYRLPFPNEAARL